MDLWRAPQPFTHERIGAVAIYCSDGRFGEAFDDFLHNQLGLPHYDLLAVPGGAAALAGHLAAYREEEALVEQLRFLIANHGLERVVLIAHRNCGFYLRKLHLSEEGLRTRQEADLAKATPDKGGHRVKALGMVRSAIKQVEAGIKFDNRR